MTLLETVILISLQCVVHFFFVEDCIHDNDKLFESYTTLLSNNYLKPTIKTLQQHPRDTFYSRYFDFEQEYTKYVRTQRTWSYIPTCFCVILIPTSKYQSLRFSAISMNSNLEVLNLANVVGLTATAVDAITRRCSKYVEMLEIVWRSLIQVSKKNCMEIIVYMTFGLKLREPKVIKVWQVKLTP